MKPLERALRSSLLAAAVSVAACGEAGSEGKGAGSAEAAGGLVGSAAPDFEAAPVKGSAAVSLAALRGKVIIVDFWGTFCEPCKKSFPKLQKLSARYKDRGLRVVGISEDEADDKDKISDFADTYGATFPIGWDEDKSIARKYRPETMPSSYVVDRKGVVRFVHVGYHDGDEAEFEQEIKDLLGE